MVQTRIFLKKLLPKPHPCKLTCSDHARNFTMWFKAMYLMENDMLAVKRYIVNNKVKAVIRAVNLGYNQNRIDSNYHSCQRLYLPLNNKAILNDKPVRHKDVVSNRQFQIFTSALVHKDRTDIEMNVTITRNRATPWEIFLIE